MSVPRIMWLTGSGCCGCGCAFEGVMDRHFCPERKVVTDWWICGVGVILLRDLGAVSPGEVRAVVGVGVFGIFTLSSGAWVKGCLGV